MTAAPSAPVVAPTLRRDLRLIVLDGVAFSVMVGLGETYLAPFALALGLSEVLVKTDDGRTGTAIYELTGAHHHRYFPVARADNLPA